MPALLPWPGGSPVRQQWVHTAVFRGLVEFAVCRFVPYSRLSMGGRGGKPREHCSFSFPGANQTSITWMPETQQDAHHVSATDTRPHVSALRITASTGSPPASSKVRPSLQPQGCCAGGLLPLSCPLVTGGALEFPAAVEEVAGVGTSGCGCKQVKTNQRVFVFFFFLKDAACRRCWSAGSTLPCL